MALHVSVYSTSCFFCFVFALSFLLTTLVCLPEPYPNQIESLMAFKNEFNMLCNNSVTNSWTNDAISFDGVSFDEETGAVTELKLHGACLYGTLDADSSLFSLHQLRYLDLSHNNFSSSFPAEFDKLTNLEFLDLHQNGFTGEISSSISNLSRLTYLDLANNKFTSSFPNVYNLTKLSSLDLSNNNFYGQVPEWLWNLPSLTAMSLSYNSFNSFEGSLEASLNSSLVYLFLSSNAFQGSFPMMIPPSMRYIAAANNNFTGEVPLSLCNPRNLLFLDLSKNSFSGSVPRCLSESLTVLNLHHNNLKRLPDTFSNSSLEMLDVGHNQIRGKLPRTLVNCVSLEFINVEDNHINDTFPFWMTSIPNLQVIVLRSNRFHGPIYSPQHPLSFPKLRIIDISCNKFNGSLPPNYFVNWSAVLASEYGGTGARWEYMGDSYSLGFHPSLNMNYKGQSFEIIRLLALYTTLDFSGNKLEGHIPQSIGLLMSLLMLNLSNNDFTGHIPSSLANLTRLESLDVSRNQLSGKIPQELTMLSSLSVLDVSYNDLMGQIPQGSQFDSFSDDSFKGNINLCGRFLNKSCLEKSKAFYKTRKEKSGAVTISYGPSLMIFVMGFGYIFLLLHTNRRVS